MADKKRGKSDPEWEEIKAYLRAVGERIDAVAALQKENAKQLRLEAAQRQKETDQRQKEADQRQKEADQRQKEADQRQEKAERRLAKTEQLVNRICKQVGGQDNRWGKIIESLVEGDLCMLMTEFLGIEIVDVSRRIEVRDVEIDLVAVDTDTVVVVEVKTTLQREHIDKFINTKLSCFTQLRPRYNDCNVYGVIAFVKVDNNAKEVINYAFSKGLIVIKAMRGTNRIINPKGCRPRNFHP